MSAPASVPRVARPSEATAFARPAYFTDIIFFMLSAIHTVANSALVKILPPQQSVRPGRRGRLSAKEPMKSLILGPMRGLLSVPYAGCLSSARGRVSFRGRGRNSVWGTMNGIRPGADEECPFGGRCRISSRGQMQDILPEADEECPFWGRCRVSSRGQMHDVPPGADTIELHEIHLARQSSLQVPVGHIPVPGGIKLCSPGTFGVANYLIINNGSCQVNFTKHAVGWSSCRKIYQQGSQQDKVIGLPVYWKAELR